MNSSQPQEVCLKKLPFPNLLNLPRQKAVDQFKKAANKLVRYPQPNGARPEIGELIEKRRQMCEKILNQIAETGTYEPDKDEMRKIHALFDKRHQKLFLSSDLQSEIPSSTSIIKERAKLVKLREEYASPDQELETIGDNYMNQQLTEKDVEIVAEKRGEVCAGLLVVKYNDRVKKDKRLPENEVCKTIREVYRKALWLKNPALAQIQNLLIPMTKISHYHVHQWLSNTENKHLFEIYCQGIPQDILTNFYDYIDTTVLGMGGEHPWLDMHPILNRIIQLQAWVGNVPVSLAAMKNYEELQNTFIPILALPEPK